MDFRNAIIQTLKQYVKIKKESNQPMIWMATANGHGKFIAITLADYGSNEINAFIVNVAAATSIFYETLFKETKEALKEAQTFPLAMFQDGDNIHDDSILVVHKLSRILFTSLKDFDVIDKGSLKYHFCGTIFSQSMNEVEELKETTKTNENLLKIIFSRYIKRVSTSF